MTMRRYYARAGGGIESLAVHEVDVPQPGYRQILVRVKATSLNYRERVILVDDAYPLPVKRPQFVPVCDGAGEVVAIGEGVTRVHVGDRVTGSVFARWLDGPFSVDFADQLGGSLDGMLTEYAVIDEDAAIAIPDHLSYEEAATFPCAGVTAWHALTSGTALLPGQTVLTVGSGAVALFAIAFAKLFGTRVIAITSSPARERALREVGADEVIDYGTTPAWHLVVRERTAGRGVDRIVESGSATLAGSTASVAMNGHIALVGAFPEGSSIERTSLRRGVFTMERIALGNRAHYLAMNRAVSFAGLRPIIDRTFAFEDARDAFRHYFERAPLGKVVIRI